MDTGLIPTRCSVFGIRYSVLEFGFGFGYLGSGPLLVDLGVKRAMDGRMTSRRRSSGCEIRVWGAGSEKLEHPADRVRPVHHLPAKRDRGAAAATTGGYRSHRRVSARTRSVLPLSFFRFSSSDSPSISFHFASASCLLPPPSPSPLT